MSETPAVTVEPTQLPQSEKSKAMKVLKRSGVAALATLVVTVTVIKLANRFGNESETTDDTVAA